MSNESTPPDASPARQPATNANPLEADALLEDPSVRDHPRHQQMFPVLTDAEIERIRRFGTPSHYMKGALLYRAGSLCPGVFVLLSGQVRIVGRDGLGHERIIHTYTQRGEFTS